MPLLQANSCLQGESHRAAELIAADRLNDGFTQTSQFAVEHGILTTGPILPGPSFADGTFSFR